MTKAPPTPKGFRDILPELAKKRRDTINKIVGVLEESGFVPVETPTIEFAETLKGKYGEEEKLIYEFKDRGGRELALRYDLTVPLARFVASNLNLIAKGPFRRYQLGQVFRGENPQKGRYREFTQLDFDSVGSTDLKEDAIVIAAAVKSLEKLGFKKFKILINDRSLFYFYDVTYNIPDKITLVLRAMDKIKKIGKEGVRKELRTQGRFPNKEIDNIFEMMEKAKPTKAIKNVFMALEELGVKKEVLEFSPRLARGLDYYTGIIFEVEIEGYLGGSVGGGGRYDNLIGMFVRSASSGQARKIPAVGFSFGLDRLIDALPDEIKQ